MDKKVWVLYCDHNDYNQHGPTLEAVWPEEPTVEQVCKLLPHIIDTSGIKTTGQLNEWLYKNQVVFSHDEWYVEEVQVGVRLGG